MIYSQQAISICSDLQPFAAFNEIELRSSDIAVKPTKASKGTVSIQTVKGRLRLCWSCQGKRYYLSLGMPDRPTNRLAAERKAKIIELDIVSDNFDQTLAKYNPKFKIQNLSVVELFQKFTDYKARQIYDQSLTKYRALQGYLTQFFRNKSVAQVTEDDAEKFKDWLMERLQPVTLRERLTLLKSCWSWGIQKKLVTENPWNFRVRVPPQQKSKPFSLREIELILQGFRTDRDYCHYADYVEFLLGTGCRIGEAIALKWKHITDDCLVVWIGEAYYRGQWKETKTGQARYVTLTSRLQNLLLNPRPDDYQPDDLVFPSPKGKPISDQNFRKRAWKTVLSKAGVEYRKPYNSRHTLTSHALDKGMSPGAVSALTGHTQETLFRSYAGNVSSRPRLPDLFE